MLNYLWAGMIVIGVGFGAFQGKMPEISQAALEGAKDAVSICITMMGVMAFWSGMMEIAISGGIIETLSKKFRSVLKFLFPKIPAGHPANQFITTNIIANMLGLGWAATPAGLQAMKALGELNEERGHDRTVASDEMCTFLILNISSLQLIPMTIIAYRTEFGSVDPTRIVGPGLLATLISTLAGILFCKYMNRRKRR